MASTSSNLAGSSRVMRHMCIRCIILDIASYGSQSELAKKDINIEFGPVWPSKISQFRVHISVLSASKYSVNVLEARYGINLFFDKYEILIIGLCNLRRLGITSTIFCL